MLNYIEKNKKMFHHTSSTQRPMIRWEEEIRDSEAELGGEGRVMAEWAGAESADRKAEERLHWWRTGLTLGGGPEDAQPPPPPVRPTSPVAG